MQLGCIITARHGAKRDTPGDLLRAHLRFMHGLTCNALMLTAKGGAWGEGGQRANVVYVMQHNSCCVKQCALHTQ